MKDRILVNILIIAFLSIGFQVKGQDTLPNFSVYEIGKNKVQISWVNPFPNCIQLSVQRSFDSLKFFSTVYSAQSPNLPQNGFADAKMPPGVKAFYRIFYVLEGGKYFFSISKPVGKPPIVVNNSVKKKPTESDERVSIEIPKLEKNEAEPAMPIKQYITIYKRTKDSMFLKLEYKDFRRFRDSIIAKTKDTLYTLGANDILFKPLIVKPIWKASTYVFTNKEGYVVLHLPKAKQSKNKLVIYEEDGTELFTIPQIKEADLVLDITNFNHAGWYFFELFEDDKLKEKNKFYLPKL